MQLSDKDPQYQIDPGCKYAKKGHSCGLMKTIDDIAAARKLSLQAASSKEIDKIDPYIRGTVFNPILNGPLIQLILNGRA